MSTNCRVVSPPHRTSLVAEHLPSEQESGDSPARNGMFGSLPSVRAIRSPVDWGGPASGWLNLESIGISIQTDHSREPRERIVRTPSHSYMLALNLASFTGSAFVDGHQCFAGVSQSGTIHICPPGSNIRLSTKEPMGSAHLFFPQLLISQTYDESEVRQTSGTCELLPVLGGMRDSIVEELTLLLVQEKTTGGSSNGLFADTVGLALLTHLMRRHSSKSQKQMPRVSAQGESAGIRRAKEYIDQHLVYPLGLADLAKSAGMSVMHFAAQFRRATGVSPHQYVLQQRIERSKRLLASSRISVNDVATAIGFETSSHFCVVFKRFVGESPARWRTMT